QPGRPGGAGGKRHRGTTDSPMGTVPAVAGWPARTPPAQWIVGSARRVQALDSSGARRAGVDLYVGLGSHGAPGVAHGDGGTRPGRPVPRALRAHRLLHRLAGRRGGRYDGDAGTVGNVDILLSSLGRAPLPLNWWSPQLREVAHPGDTGAA